MSDNFYELVSRGQSLIEIERHADAIPMLAKALALEPDSHDANGLMALAHLGLKKFDPALAYADRAVESEPDEEWGHRIRSMCLSAIGRNREALAAAEEAVRLEPREPMALSTLAEMQVETNQHKKAKQTSEKLLEVAPEWDGAHFTMGNVHLAMGDNYLAEKSFKEALRINPNSANARNNLGVAVLRQRTDSKGSMFGFRSNSIIDPPGTTEEHFHEALKLEPDNEQAAENFRNQYSYLLAIIPIFAFIPFMMISFVVIPLGTLISLGITIFWSIKAFNDVRRKRAALSPEMREFVKLKSYFGEGGVLSVIGNTIWHCIYKTWKPHLLAAGSLAILLLARATQTPGLRLVSVFSMIGAFYWLAAESRKPD